MLFAYILLWAAAATASKHPDGLSSKFNLEDGSLTDSKEDPDVTAQYVYCDPKTEETCYDEWYNAVSCSLISEGGCPCPGDQIKCDADLANGCVGWCTEVCCDWDNEYACWDSKVCVKYGDPCPCPRDKMECYPGTGVCSSICCDDITEETCYGRDGVHASSCAKYADGGCDCPHGQKRCGADPTFDYLGWCAMECCDGYEESCYEYDHGYSKPFTKQYCKAIVDGGCPCPTGQEKCGVDPSINSPGWCADVCCDFYTEEQCFNPPSCAPISSGGCPCPQGQEKCGADPAYNYTGYCTDVCCDPSAEETCYNSTGCFYNQYCAAIADGGCPCPEGMKRCGADLDNNIVGWCDYICCDTTTEEYCYAWDDNSDTPTAYCAEFANGGCPCPEGMEKCGADYTNNIVGWCDYICCNAEKEETCYVWDDDSDSTTAYCAAFAEGGCPCPEGMKKCGADYDNNFPGWCDTICCNATIEVLCYDCGSDTCYPYCAPKADGITCPEGLGAESYLRHLETKVEKLPAMNGGNNFEKGTSREKFALKGKIESLRHAIKFNAMPAHLSVGKNHEQ